MAYLKHKDTGEILPYNPDLALSVEMIPCDVNGVPEVHDPDADEPPKTVHAKKKKADPTPDEFLSGLGV
jgi:hypothetical protein